MITERGREEREEKDYNMQRGGEEERRGGGEAWADLSTKQVHQGGTSVGGM